MSGGVKGIWARDGTIFKNTKSQRRGQYQREGISLDCGCAGNIMGESSRREREIESGVEDKGHM